MVLKKDQERIKLLLKDTITLLCKNGLTFKNEFSIEATIGITLDQDEVVLVSINELIKSELGAAKLLDSSEIEVRNSKDNGDRHETDSRPGSVSPTTGRRRKRRRSRNTMSNTDQSNDYESFDEDNTSHTSDLEPPMKKMQSDIKIEAEGDSDDLVFVKQEIDAGDWMPIDEHGHGGGGTEQEQDSFHGSFPGSSQENSDFLQGSMEQLMAGQSGSPNRMPRRTATVTSNSTPGRSNSQMGDSSGPLQLVTVKPEKSVPVPQQDDENSVKPLMLTSKAPNTATLTGVRSVAGVNVRSDRLVPSIQAQAALAHNLVMLSPSLLAAGLRQPLALMSPPLGLPLAQTLAMIPQNSKSLLTAANLNISVPPVSLPRHVANLTVTSPSIRGPRLANDLPLSFSAVDTLFKSYGKGGKLRRSSACSSVSSMDPPVSPVEKVAKSRGSKPSRRSSVDVMVLKLNENQEKEIITFINNMASLGYKVTVKEVCKMAHEMIFPKRQYKKVDCGNLKTFGPDWWKEFLVRHPEILEKEGQVLPCSAPKSV